MSAILSGSGVRVVAAEWALGNKAISARRDNYILVPICQSTMSRQRLGMFGM